jgi:hypothetical protein
MHTIISYRRSAMLLVNCVYPFDPLAPIAPIGDALVLLLCLYFLRDALGKTDEWVWDWDPALEWGDGAQPSSSSPSPPPPPRLSRDAWMARKFERMSPEYPYTAVDLEGIERRAAGARDLEMKKQRGILMELREEHARLVTRAARLTELLEFPDRMLEHYNRTIDELHADTYDECGDNAWLGEIDLADDADGFLEARTDTARAAFYGAAADRHKNDAAEVRDLIDEMEARPALSTDPFIEKEKTAFAHRQSFKLLNNMLFDHVDGKTIAMHYDPDLEGFKYFVDGYVPFDYVRRVGERYSVTFHCKYVWSKGGEKDEDANTGAEGDEKGDDEPTALEKERAVTNTVFVPKNTPRIANRVHDVLSNVKFVRAGSIRDARVLQKCVYDVLPKTPTPAAGAPQTYSEWKKKGATNSAD